MSDEQSASLPASYRAWVWRAGSDPRSLVVESVPMQAAEPGSVIVRNAAIGLNPVDWKVLGGQLLGWQPGKVPGVDGAGVVAAVGDGVPAGWLGRRVAYHQSLARPGSFAEYTPVALRALMRLPEALDFDIAAGFPCPALTAWMAIEKLPIRPGQALLVSGAGGAVGQYLVQMASSRGFAVTAMCNPRHWTRLQGLGASACLSGPLGADHCWADDGGPRFFAAIDSVGADHAALVAPSLLANGHLVCIQGRLEQWPCEPFGRALSLHEVALGALHRFGDDASWERLTSAGEGMLADIAAKRLQPEGLVVRGFMDLPHLLQDLKCRQFSGKPVVRI